MSFNFQGSNHLARAKNTWLPACIIKGATGSDVLTCATRVFTAVAFWLDGCGVKKYTLKAFACAFH